MSIALNSPSRPHPAASPASRRGRQGLPPEPPARRVVTEVGPEPRRRTGRLERILAVLLRFFALSEPAACPRCCSGRIVLSVLPTEAWTEQWAPAGWFVCSSCDYRWARWLAFSEASFLGGY